MEGDWAMGYLHSSVYLFIDECTAKSGVRRWAKVGRGSQWRVYALCWLLAPFFAPGCQGVSVFPPFYFFSEPETMD